MRASISALLMVTACSSATPPAHPSEPPGDAVHDAPSGATDGASTPSIDASPTRSPSQWIDAPSPAPAAGDPGACTVDGDCTVTNWAGCCACPQCSAAPPYAITTRSLELGQRACAVATCDMSACAVGGMCPPGEPAAHFVAQCRAGACTMRRR